MPNWTYNRIKCKKEIGDKLLTIKDDIYSLDFNKLIPMPEDLKLDAGSIESDSISCYYLSLNDDEKYNCPFANFLSSELLARFGWNEEPEEEETSSLVNLIDVIEIKEFCSKYKIN